MAEAVEDLAGTVGEGARRRVVQIDGNHAGGCAWQHLAAPESIDEQVTSNGAAG